MNSENDERLCDSQIWWPTIKSIAVQYETILNYIGNKNSVFVQLDAEKLNSALKMYERGWWSFKEHIYGENAKNERIDRHKIIALYILSILAKKPFHVNTHPENKEADRRLFLANELFSLEVMMELICAWNEKDDIFEMNEKEKKWFILLLNYFKLKFIESKPAFVSDAPSSMTDFLALSQVVYYVERAYI